MIIADTNVVSEFMKDEPAPAVLSWAQGHPAADLIICVVTVEEIERGLGRLPAGKRRQSLTRRWHEIIDAFSESIAMYDLAAARTTATVLVEAEEGGHPMGLADAQIAGICVSGGCVLATRNVRDFEHVSDLSLINPFT